MKEFTALVDWPSAPLTDSLVRKSLASLQPVPSVVTSLADVDVPSLPCLLQWSSYDSIDHDISYAPPSGSSVLSSSYIIRKALIRKHYLSRCIHNYLAKHTNSILTRASPKTWDLEISFADELDEMWGDELWDLGQELEKEDPAKWWILKPGMADRGMGIRLFHTKEDLTRIFEAFEENDEDENEDAEGLHDDGNTGIVASQLRHFVIQEYLSEPLLVDPLEVPIDGESREADLKSLRGHKFHLRVYCVASGALTVYLYNRILTLFSSVPYSPPQVPKSSQKVSAGSDGLQTLNSNLSAHLTNTSLQVERGEAGVRLLDELIGCHVLASSPPSEEGEAQAEFVLTAQDIEDIRIQIVDVLAETFKAALDMSVHFQPLPNAFELYGVDFLVTRANPAVSSRKYQVHLLEVNSEPAIELTGPRLTWILEDLFRAIGKVCVAPFFEHAGNAESRDNWEIGQAREALTKCLELEVRRW